VIEGDTAAVPVGTGTFGSRSIAVGGSALHRAADKVLNKGKQIAAHLLEAAAANVAHRLPLETLEPGLDESAFYDPPNFAFSNGAHVCELEVDPETGEVELVSYHAVDDIGTVINPLIVEGPAPLGFVHGLRRAARG
jgi:aerobic carbon-monoxide dehydrogenase large subunit